MPFKRRKDEESKYNMHVRMTFEEADSIKESAARSGLSASEYVRRKALGKVVKARVDEKMIAELSRVGGLLKHVHVESQGAYSQHTAEMLHELQTVIRMIGREVKDDL